MMCRTRTGCHRHLFALCTLLLAGLAVGVQPASAVLIAYWDFNDSVGTTGPADLIVDQGFGTLTTNFDTPDTNVTHFTGTTIGALPGVPPANRDLGLVAGTNQINNGRYITFAIDTSGKTGIVVTYATQRSANGFNSVQVSYSTDGGANFTNFGLPYDPPTSYALNTFDFGALLDNSAGAQVRITFDGASSTTGNNRLDNIKFFSGGVPTGACCQTGGTCTVTTADNCLNTLLGNYLGDATACGTCPNYAGIVINEIRVDQTGTDTDEYFEIAGPPGASLGGLTYIVIGDGDPLAASGVVEMALDLSGHTIPADGRFLVAADNDTLQAVGPLSPHATADMVAVLNFENSDNVTHMLVSGFRGFVDQDLDTNDDCVLDPSPPWVSEVDRIAIVEEANPPVSTECHYGDFGASPPTAIGPELVGSMYFMPGHVFRYDTSRQTSGAPCSQCGPGSHWIDSCSAGTDQIADNGAVVGIDTTTDGNLDCQVDVSLVLNPCSTPNNLLTISRSAPLNASVNFPTVTGPPGHAAPDVIDTEIVSMCLTGGGVTLKAGFGTGNGGVLGHSYGAIAERTGDPTLGDSFFDVFFEVDLGGGNFAYNQTALRIQAAITCVPPKVTYIHPTGCLPLYTSPVGGIQIANLVTAKHDVNLPDGPGRTLRIGPFEPTTGDDTPGTVNALSTGACCASGVCTTRTRDACAAASGTWKGREASCTPNPCVGACCDANLQCTIAYPEQCAAANGAFQGDATTCVANQCAACSDIATARTVPINGPAKICNAIVTSRTDLISSTNQKSFAIQDTSGTDGQTAITVFGLNAPIDTILAGVQVGDLMDIQGTIGTFNGVLELVNGTGGQMPLVRTRLVCCVGVPPPKPITIADLQDLSPTAEALESEYVQLSCVAFVAGNGTNMFAGLTNYTVTDGTGYATVRVSTAALELVGVVIPTGPVTLRGIFSQFDGADPRDSFYQLLLRGLGFGDPDDVDGKDVPCNFPSPNCASNYTEINPPSCGPTGACCLPGPTCRADLTPGMCAGLGGVYQLPDGSVCGSVTCPTADGVVINEIRADEPTAGDPNEYFELKGPPNVPLGSLTYIVIGNNTTIQGSGVIEAIVPLSLQVMPPSGLFLAAESTFTLGTANLTTTLNFEDGNNRTHMLVEGFFGTNLQDLDTNDDGVLDVTPWTRILSSIAIVENTSNPLPAGTVHYYGPTVGPVPGGFTPGHVIRCPGALNDFIIGTYDTVAGNDTPGAENDCTAACLTCPGDTDGSGRVDLNDVDEFVNALLGITPNTCADVNIDTKVDAADIYRFIGLVLASANGTSCLPPSLKEVVRCDNAGTPCPNSADIWCVYTVDINQVGISPCIIASGPSGDTTMYEGEQFCVKCPAPSGPCGTPGDKVQFRWINHDGAGNDCTFLATLQNPPTCTNCSSFNKRFGDAPPPTVITVLDWNLLQYTGGRATDYKAVLDLIKPDVVICQEVENTTGRDAFLAVLNTVTGTGDYATGGFSHNGGDNDNALYFRTSRISYSAPDYTTVATSPRVTDRWKIGLVGYTAADTKIYIYAAHLKAGNAQSDIDSRACAAKTIRDHANLLPAGTNIIIAGDFNVRSSSENPTGGCATGVPVYVSFTGSQVDNDGRVFDPINQPGTWNANPSFACIHTQSPHQNNAGAPSGASTGGMDDRFDFQLLSATLNDGTGLTYKAGSYRAYGNDCSHFNNDINDPPTIPEGSTIANALHACSDHLPVVMQILLPTPP